MTVARTAPMSLAAGFVLLAGGAACAPAAKAVPPPAGARPVPSAAASGTPRETDDRTEATVPGPAVEAKLEARVPGRPPMETLLIDVTLRNAEKEPRWFLLPERIPADAGPDEGGVFGVEAWVAEGKGGGRAVIGKFLGTAGFQALLVPAGGVVRLEGFGIPRWRATARNAAKTETIPIEVTIAKSVTVGGQPIRSWFGTLDPASGAKVIADASKATRAGSKMTDDRGEVPFAVEDAEHVTVELALP